MLQDTPRPNSLVLYKQRPAHVKTVGDKLEIGLEDGKTLRVRPKDITLLHPGPLNQLADLRPQRGEVKVAWELLAGSTTTLPELAELIYEQYTPVTAWATWELVDDGLYFSGTPEAIQAATPEEVAQEQTNRAAKEAEKQAWNAFLARARAGQRLPEEDDPFLREVEDLAYKRRSDSRILRELGRGETPEQAHALLLELGYWDTTVNPYPVRLELPTDPPAISLPPLPAEQRVDLTHLPAFAIDDEGSHDPDDALSLEGNRLWVHVADVAALIPPDSEADIEARARGANLYLPEGTVPMLPPQATQILALGLSEISPALSFGLDLAKDGTVEHVEVVPSRVKVQRLTYEEAITHLEEEPLRSLYQIAQTHFKQRQANGAISIDLPEVKVRVIDGQIVIKPLPALKSRDLVREAMLMTGEAIARFALSEQIPFPFSTQEPPEEGDFTNTLAGMFARRRTLTRSQLSSVPAPHAGLGLDLYSQATSPLRRYLDLVVHQQLRAYLTGANVLTEAELLERVGAAEAITGSIRQAERLSNKHWTLVYLNNRPKWRGKGVLVDKWNSRGVILIPELDLEIRQHLRQNLPLDAEVSLTLRGVNLPELDAHFSLGR